MYENLREINPMAAGLLSAAGQRATAVALRGLLRVVTLKWRVQKSKVQRLESLVFGLLIILGRALILTWMARFRLEFVPTFSWH